MTTTKTVNAKLIIRYIFYLYRQSSNGKGAKGRPKYGAKPPPAWSHHCRLTVILKYLDYQCIKTSFQKTGTTSYKLHIILLCRTQFNKRRIHKAKDVPSQLTKAQEQADHALDGIK